MSDDWYYWAQDKLFLRIRLQPRASRTEISGPHGGELKVRVAAPPVDGEANASLIAFLAEACRVPKCNVEMTAGRNSRSKLVSVMRPTRLPPGVKQTFNNDNKQ